MDSDVHRELKVPNCSQCKGDVEFYCKTCKEDLCVLCKEKHMIDLDSKYHEVVIDRLKYGDFRIPNSCEKHQNKYVNKWCFSCNLPICDECYEHRNHDNLDIVSAYKMCRHQHIDRIAHIRTDIIFNNLALLQQIKCDVKISKDICQSLLSGLQQSMTTRTMKLKNLAGVVINDINELKQLKRSLTSKLKEPKRKITNTEIFIYKLETVLDKPIHFLMFLKKTPFPRLTSMLDTFPFSLNCKINRMDVIKLLGEIQITESKNRHVRNEQLLEPMCVPVLRRSFTVMGDTEIRHISCVTTDMVWINDQYGRIILTNANGEHLHIFKDTNSYTGGHSMTPEGNLIYIDRFNNVNQLSTDNIITLIKITEPWKAKCVYCSPTNGDLLVGMNVYYFDQNKMFIEAKVMRYNSAKQQIQFIENCNTRQKLYIFPKYITENHNGDVIVSDLNHGIVVTDREGKHRFFYTGPSSGPRLSPRGVCVDALSNILVCDIKSKTIQMIDKDGHFLSLLFTNQNKINVSGGLDYDHRNHLLLVGTKDHNSRVDVYRYIKRKDYFTHDQHD
ncbi:uncharacterized protein LOC134235921 [Saccostrea cucullata]|uniref:uncharacterized protein LOC134235921 n=1 Tax=Saccostrea cuccullata TaxID=36930 RepID=UPI002ED04773